MASTRAPALLLAPMLLLHSDRQYGNSSPSFICSRSSSWQRSRMQCEARPEPKRIVVIGGGVIGASIAYHLAVRAKQPRSIPTNVVLLDSGEERPASEMTWGLVNSFHKKPLAYHQLSQLSVRAWPELLHRLGCPEAARYGTLYCATDDVGVRGLKDRLRAAQELGHTAQHLSLQDAQKVAGSCVALGDCKMAVYIANEGVVNAELAAATARASVKELGGVVAARKAEKLAHRADGRLDVVCVDGEKLVADVVVLAAGLGCKALAATLGVALPVKNGPDEPSYAQESRTSELPCLPFFCRMHAGADGKLLQEQVICRNDGRVMVDSFPAVPTEDRIRSLQEHMPQVTTWNVTPVITSKPVPCDGMPIVGFVDDGRVYVCVTHSGVTLAPILGHYASLECMEAVTVEALEPYRLQRFAAQSEGRAGP